MFVVEGPAAPSSLPLVVVASRSRSRGSDLVASVLLITRHGASSLSISQLYSSSSTHLVFIVVQHPQALTLLPIHNSTIVRTSIRKREGGRMKESGGRGSWLEKENWRGKHSFYTGSLI